MRAFLAGLLVLLTTVCGRAQQRHATVTLDDGKVLEGTVVAMDLASLQISIDGVVQTLSAARIQSCHFVDAASAAPAELLSPAESAGSASVAVAQPAVASPSAQEPESRRKPAATTTLSFDEVPGADVDPESVPHDLRHRTLLESRLEALDEAYPWLCPTAPVQWGSLGFLLFTLMTLVVHVGTKVCGAEFPSLGRCMLITLWYLVSGVVQVAFVPVLHVTTVAMLIGNSAMALFCLCSLFGMTRGAAVLAFAVQLGFVLLGYGVLQLVDALLKSVGSPLV
jgi:hypothetical protein